jgi:hypothetical protein
MTGKPTDIYVRQASVNFPEKNTAIEQMQCA